MSVPNVHLEEGLKLTADALIDLFAIVLVDNITTFRFKADNTATWQGNTYTGVAIQMSGDRRSSDNEESRPTLRIMNPNGIFNKPALLGRLDRAIVVRRRVLGRHLEADANISQQRMWYIERVKELVSDQFIGLELRSLADGPAFQLPARIYTPPEFPSVTL